MNTPFDPELGQLVFGGGADFDYEMEEHVKSGLAELGALLAPILGQDPTDNVAEAFANDVFSLRSYCWCGNSRPGHEEACPPNFVCGDFGASWYKWLGRGGSQPRPLAAAEWAGILRRCCDSLAPCYP